MIKKKMTKKLASQILFYVCIIAWPVFQFAIMWVAVNINSFTLAFKKWDVDLSRYIFVGFENFSDVFNDLFNEGLFLTSIGNSFVFYGIHTFIMMPISILVAYYIHRKLFFSGFFKIVLHLPSFISGVILVVVFKFLADRGYPEIIYKITGVQPYGLLVGSKTAFPTIVCYWLYFQFGSGLLLYVGAMNSIDLGLFEAARLDGAGMMREFLHVIIPGIFPTVSTFLITGVAGLLTADPNLFLFYNTTAPTKYWTFGYYMFVGVLQSSPKSGYSYYAAFGLILTAMAIPLVFGMRYLLSKIDPMRED